MPRNGSGTYAAPANSFNPAVTGNTASPTDWNSTLADISSALTSSIAKDGQTVITANLPMAGYKHTNVGAAVNRTDYARYDQLQDASVNWVDGGGTADAITATYNPAIATLIDGQLFFVRATAANATTTPTFSPNGLPARTIVKTGGAALSPGDIAGDGHELILRYDLANTRYELLNPSDADAARKSVNNTFTGTNTFNGTSTFNGPTIIPDGTVSTTAKLADGIVTQAKISAGYGLVPSGAILGFAMSAVPSGWLECDGSAVSRTTYAALFSAISTMYGVGDGSTTFNLPDYRGEFLRGYDHGRGADPDAATRTNRGDGTTGNNIGTKQTDAFKAHAHTYNAFSGGGLSAAANGTSGNGTNSTSLVGGTETRPRNVYVMYCIKT